MAVQQYGVLKGIVLDMKRETDDDSPHFQVKMLGEENTYYRCAINVMSSSEESEVLYLADDQFDSRTDYHPSEHAVWIYKDQ